MMLLFIISVVITGYLLIDALYNVYPPENMEYVEYYEKAHPIKSRLLSFFIIITFLQILIFIVRVVLWLW